MAGKFEVYKGSDGKFRWRLLAGNGRSIASGEAYETKASAVRGAHVVREVAGTADPEVAVASISAAEDDRIIREAVEASGSTAVLEAVSDRPAAGHHQLDETYWGPAPTGTETRTTALADLQRQFSARQRLLDRSITRAQAAHLLGVTEQTVSTLISSGDLLTIKEGREHRIPVWQFNAGAERGILPGIRKLHDVYPGGLASLSEWVELPNVEFDGATPVELLAKGKIEAVVDIARIGTAAAW